MLNLRLVIPVSAVGAAYGGRKSCTGTSSMSLRALARRGAVTDFPEASTGLRNPTDF
jgi:hypothetical protein